MKRASPMPRGVCSKSLNIELRGTGARSPGVKSYSHHPVHGAACNSSHRSPEVVLLSINRLAIMRPPCGTSQASESASSAC